jgi:diguanylate cyclase (GGDEF)-like protein
VETDPAPQRGRGHLGHRVSVWHHLLLIAVLPCLGVCVLAGVIVDDRVGDAADARRIERTMVSIQRLDELHRALNAEATSVAVFNGLAALGITAAEARRLAGYVPLTVPAEARAATDTALASARADPEMVQSLEQVVAALATARADAGGAGAAGEAARARAWTAIQDYRKVTQLIADAQSAATDAVVTGRRGSGSRDVLRAADQLQTISDLVVVGTVRASDYYLTFLAPLRALPGVRAELKDVDVAYRLAAADAGSHFSPAVLRAWDEFRTGPRMVLLDRYVARAAAAPVTAGTPPLTDLIASGRALADHDAGMTALLASAVAEGRAAAARDREAATRRAQVTTAATGVLLAATLGTLAVLGGLIRRRLGGVADAAKRLSSGRLEPMPVRGPREIALASAGLNDAVASLRQVQATAEKLAAGDLGSAELRRPTPGPLGAAVHASVVLLTDSFRERERLQQELAHQAAHDSLTGLPNRAEAERLLGAALARGGRVGLLFVDLDHFKQVNDSFGHHAGDHVLQVSATRMTAEVREPDTVCRLGGDEFVVVLDPAESDQVVTAIGSRIVAALSLPVTYDGHELRVGASVGAAVSAGDGREDPEELLSRADHAVYRAKAAGRNGLAF